MISAMDQTIVKAFLDAVQAWTLDGATACMLAGVPQDLVSDWESWATMKFGEKSLARMRMVAQIRTALDISWSPSLASQWMSLPNRGELFKGISPVDYIQKHHWPGLYTVLCQVQAWAVGN